LGVNDQEYGYSYQLKYTAVKPGVQAKLRCK